MLWDFTCREPKRFEKVVKYLPWMCPWQDENNALMHESKGCHTYNRQHRSGVPRITSQMTSTTSNEKSWSNHQPSSLAVREIARHPMRNKIVPDMVLMVGIVGVRANHQRRNNSCRWAASETQALIKCHYRPSMISQRPQRLGVSERRDEWPLRFRLGTNLKSPL